MTELGLSLDFTGLSTLLLGQAQPNQFQSADQTLYWWSSKVTSLNPRTTTDSFFNNAFTDMPREYYAGSAIGGAFNWYSATAESGTYNMSNNKASDSICPSGWQLPGWAQNEDKTWANLLINAYGYANEDTAGYQAMYGSLFNTAGLTYYNTGGSVGSQASFWTSLAKDRSDTYGPYAGTLGLWGNRIHATNSNQNSLGLLVRCVQK